MIPIQKLLSRIRWDPSFGDARFELQYEDRKAGLVRISLGEITEVGPESFTITDEAGRYISVPLHRIRTVYRNGERIWSRLKG
ncbi:MAG: DUF504 domain-containing protein [Chitinispirillaceae bacterium]